MPISLGDAVLYLRVNASDLNTKLNQAKSDAQKNFGAITDAARSIGIAMTAVGAAITAGMGVSVAETIKFESAFAGIRKTVNATEGEFKKLEAGIKSMSLQMPVSANELAHIGEIAGQLGIKKENILSFTDTIAKLGVATNLSGEEAAMMLARFSNITGLPQDKFENLASSIVDLGNNSATTEKDIMEMAMRIAGAGTTAGLAPPKILGVAAALSSLGIEAEAGGTAFSQLLLKMQMSVRGKMPTDEIEKLNEKLRELTDSHNAKIEQLGERLENVRDRIKGIKEQAAQDAYEERINAQIQAARRAGNEAYAAQLEAELERSRSLLKQQQQQNELQKYYQDEQELLAQMAKENSDYEQARKKIEGLLNGTGEALAGFAKIAGVSVQEFKDLFEKDATKAVEKFLQGLGKIQDEKGDVGGALAEIGLEGIRMTDALLRASNAGDLFGQSVERGMAAFEKNTAAAKEAAERFKTMESQLGMLKNAYALLKDEIGRALLPVLSALAKILKPILEFIAEMIETFPNLSKVIIVPVAALGLLMGAIGPLLIAAQPLLSLFIALKVGAVGFGGALLPLVGGAGATGAAGAAAGGGLLATLGTGLVALLPALGALALGFVVLYPIIHEVIKRKKELKEANENLKKSEESLGDALDRRKEQLKGMGVHIDEFKMKHMSMEEQRIYLEEQANWHEQLAYQDYIIRAAGRVATDADVNRMHLATLNEYISMETAAQVAISNMTEEQIKSLYGLSEAETRTRLEQYGITLKVAEDKTKVIEDATNKEVDAYGSIPIAAKTAMNGTQTIFTDGYQTINQGTQDTATQFQMLSLDNNGVNESINASLMNTQGMYQNSFNNILSNAQQFSAQMAQTLSQNMPPNFQGVPGYAKGGIVQAPLQIVGEQGPELAALPVGTHIYTASETESMLKGQGSSTSNNASVTNNFNISSLVVREEADIDRISSKLHRLVMKDLRAMGVA